MCPDASVIGMHVENVSGAPLSTSVAVERLDDSGLHWREYSADVLGTNPLARAVVASGIAKGGSLDIVWRPRVASHARRLAEGTYRIVATSTADGRPPARRSILGGFVVKRAGVCPKPSRTGPRTGHGERSR